MIAVGGLEDEKTMGLGEKKDLEIVYERKEEEWMGWEGGMIYFLGRGEETAFGRKGKTRRNGKVRGKDPSYGLL